MTEEQRRVRIATHLYTVDAMWESLSHPGRNMDTDEMREWAASEHSGDCTQESHSCDRCRADGYLGLADLLIEQRRVPPSWLMRNIVDAQNARPAP